jgi:hypothetical protein
VPIDLSLLDAGAFRDWIVGQRWFGSKSREVAQIEISECVPLREETPQLALALVEARFGEGTHETYHSGRAPTRPTRCRSACAPPTRAGTSA